MTEAEALALKPGDRVEAKYGTGWRVVQVVQVVLWTREALDNDNDRGWRLHSRGVLVGSVRHVSVRSILRTTKGNRSAIVRKPLRKIRPYQPEFDPVTGNVFADFLEESGYPEAAEALRRRFPLATGEV